MAYKISGKWHATFLYKGEHIGVTFYNRKTQPAAFEFVSELRKKRPGIDMSKVQLLEIREG